MSHTPVQIEVQLKVKDLGGLVTQRRSLRLVTHTCPNRSTAEGEGLGGTCHTKEELETCHTHLSEDWNLPVCSNVVQAWGYFASTCLDIHLRRAEA